MKKSLMVMGLSLMVGARLFAQQNPACANPQLNPNPLANIGSQFNLSYVVGNNGTIAIPGTSETQQMRFTISLGKCKPSVNGVISTIGTDALSGAALSYFDVTYDALTSMYSFVQKQNVAINAMELYPIVVHAQVTQTATTNQIGGSLNVQPNAAASQASQPTGDDQVSIFTITTGAPLPVTLEHFEARAAGCVVGLSWNTASEQNFDHFEIEHGQDKGYSAIGTVKAKGNNSSYSFTDTKPAIGINTYRLKMVDADGTFTYSEVASAKASCPVAATALSVYPNPTTASVYVKGLKEGSTLRLMDATGRVLIEKTNSATVESFDLSRLSSALYTVQVIENGTLVTTVKVSRQ